MSRDPSRVLTLGCVLGAALTMSCDSAEPVTETCAVGEPDHWVISELTFARRDNGVVAGFDIDGHDSGATGDGDGCFKPDLVDPDGVAGIDNNFSALVPVLEATEAVAAESLVKQSIAAGELLITVSLDGVDDWLDDTCVDFTLARAGGVPLVAADGTILDLQTLAPDPSVQAVSSEGFAERGRIHVEGLQFNLPLDVLNAELDFQVTRGQFWVQRRYDDALTGVMGGVIPIRQITEILERTDVNLQEFVPLVEATADIQDDNGDCTMLSLAFEFEALPVYLEP